jgi:tight adherence protein B
MPAGFWFNVLVLFIVVLSSAVLGLRIVEALRKKQVSGMLATVAGAPETPVAAILRESGAGRRESRLARRLDALLKQAALNIAPEKLLARMAAGAVIGAAVGALLPIPAPAALNCLGVALVFAALPYRSVVARRRKRLAEFEEQFPEALDFLARSMRAGHAFTISLEMLGQEAPDPLGIEFRTLFNEQNLGSPLETALKNLTERVPLVDVRFFASSVMLQRQTGGNLGEILGRLAYVIRERFRLKGQVKAASAHGRLTATILVALPILTMAAMFVVAPGYLQGMAGDPDGQHLIAGAIAGQVLGHLVIKKIIRIKV